MCKYGLRASLVAISVAGFLAAYPVAPKAEQGWQDLFDGKTLAGWMNEKGGPPGAGWVVQDGLLHRKARAGSLLTRKEYQDFELEFEWRIAPRGNSGVKYRLQRTAENGWLGPEYQIIDDTGARDAVKAITSTAALYELKEPGPGKSVRPVGEFNQSRIVARGTIIEHWLNGVKVLNIDTDSREYREKFAASKYNIGPDAVTWFARKPGPIMLQDHGAEVWFRNIRIR